MILPFALALTGGTWAAALAAHPLHTSLAELVYDPASKEMQISIRVFIDDLTKASAAYAKAHPVTRVSSLPAFPNAAVIEYARASFVLADRGGHPLPLLSCGVKPVGDLMWVCMRARTPTGPVGLQVAHRILFDLYADQINIVQAAYNGKRISLLFTRGEGLKRLD